MKDVLEPFSDIGAPATACWCACFNFEDSSRPCDEHKAALVAEVQRLRELVQSTHGLQRNAEAERDAAVAEAARVREALQAAREFVGWLTAMAQPTHEALETRRVVTLSDTISRARAALRALDAALDGAE